MIKAIKAMYMFIIVDRFLTMEYKNSYTAWKSMDSTATDKFALDVKELEAEDVAKYHDMEDYWSQYGPIASGVFVLSTVCTCFGIMVC